MPRLKYNLITHTFVLLAIVLVPFTFYLSPFKTSIGQVLLGDFINFVLSSFFEENIVIPISSDSIGMYVIFFIIIVMSIILSFLISIMAKASFQNNLIKFIRIISTIFLSLILFKYGCDKIFIAQFYKPEPNILYTHFGKLDRDILYWSIMGLSWKHSLFLGIIEVIIAFGLLFRKTRVLSLFLGLFTILYIVVVNFSFDISVKLFSSFLLIINLILIFPFLKRTILFMSGKEVEKIGIYKVLPESFNSKTKVLLMASILFLIISEGIAPHVNNYILSSNNIAKHNIHGAFKAIDNNPKDEKLGIKRIYFHKDNYIIFHFENNNQIDFYYEFYREEKENSLSLLLFNYEEKTHRIDVMRNGSSKLKFHLQGLFGLGELNLIELDHEELPALQEKFHWSIESVQ